MTENRILEELINFSRDVEDFKANIEELYHEFEDLQATLKNILYRKRGPQ